MKAFGGIFFCGIYLCIMCVLQGRYFQVLCWIILTHICLGKLIFKQEKINDSKANIIIGCLMWTILNHLVTELCRLLTFLEHYSLFTPYFASSKYLYYCLFSFISQPYAVFKNLEIKWLIRSSSYLTMYVFYNITQKLLGIQDIQQK